MPAASTQTHIHNPASNATFPVLLKLPQPLLHYNIVIAILKGDLSAISILKDAVELSEHLHMANLLLALGPTTPFSLQPQIGTRILWATFADRDNQQGYPRLTIIPPSHMTDLSLSFEKLSKTRTSRIPLIAGDFLDNVLSVSSDPAGLYSFLCKLFTRIRTNAQTAFFLVTEDMHDPKKIAILKRFADAVIEYRRNEEGGLYKFEVRILDHMRNQYRVLTSSSDGLGSENATPLIAANRMQRVGRQHNPYVQEPMQVGF